MSRRLLTALLPVLVGLLMLGAWYSFRLHVLAADQRFLLPAPDAILRALIDNAPALASATLTTATGAFLGFAFAAIIGVLLALGLSLSPLIRAGFYPYLMILQLTPVIVLAPILILWVGPGLQSVVVITFLICFFPLVVNTTQGLISTDRHLVELFRMGRASRLQEILLLRLPAALPYFFTGLRIAATLAPIGAIVGDAYAGNSGGGQGGLGFLTIIYSARLQLPALFATAALGCLLGFLFAGAIVALSWLVLRRWHDAYQSTDS